MRDRRLNLACGTNAEMEDAKLLRICPVQLAMNRMSRSYKEITVPLIPLYFTPGRLIRLYFGAGYIPFLTHGRTAAF